MLGWTQLHYATARSDRDAVARLLAICRLGCKARPSCGDPCPRLQGLYSIYVCICIYRVHVLVKPKKVISFASSGDIGQAPGGSQDRSFFGGTLRMRFIQGIFSTTKGRLPGFGFLGLAALLVFLSWRECASANKHGPLIHAML